MWKAIDKKTRETVALKKIFDAFQVRRAARLTHTHTHTSEKSLSRRRPQNATDAQRTFREILFLQELGDHENIVSLLNVHKAENDKDIYLVREAQQTPKKRLVFFFFTNQKKTAFLHFFQKKIVVFFFKKK